MRPSISIVAALATLAFSACLASAAIPPAPAQAIAAAQGAATPQSVQVQISGTSYSGPANPTRIPPAPGVFGHVNNQGQMNNSPDQWRFRWDSNRWWYWSSDNRWLLFGQNGWSDPVSSAGNSVGGAVRFSNVPAVPSGYYYSPGRTYYVYPGYGNYYPSRFPARNPGLFSGRTQ